MKVNRQAGFAFMRFRNALVANCECAADVKRLARIGREDIEFLKSSGVITPEEAIQLGCTLSLSVQNKLNQLLSGITPGPRKLYLVRGVQEAAQ